MDRLAGSDYMAWTKAGYPAAFATEGNPLARGGFPGDFDPYVHSDKDRMDVNDDQGVFSIDVSEPRLVTSELSLTGGN